MKYRVFVQDVGTTGYSGYIGVSADTPKIAVAKARGNKRLPKLIALPYNRKDLWPNSTTGEVPDEALDYC